MVDVADGADVHGLYTSDPIHVTTAGTYHWIANYSGDANNNPTANGCNEANENVVVDPRSPTVTTNAGPNVTLGVDGTDLTDNATLADGTTNPAIGGSITFKLYSDPNCQTQVGTTQTATVAGNGPYSGTVHVDNAGTYYWIANYTGDANNSATTNGCGEPNESVVVNPRKPVVTTNAGPNVRLGLLGADLTDLASLSDGTTNISGTITFDLYSGDTCQPGTLVGSVTKAVSGNGLYESPPVHVTQAGVYHWIANYGGDANNEATSNGCNEANENVRVVAPGIMITKTAETPTILSGGTATFTITVENTGDVPLTNVHVTDAQAPDCARTAAEIALIAPHSSSTFLPGESVTYSCTLAGQTASFTNHATATGSPAVGADVTDNDDADVKVIHPAIKITKDTTTPTIVSGGTASFTITIKNIGDSTLDNVKVDDTIAPDCARTPAEIALIAPHLSSTFAPGDEVSYTCTLVGQTASFTNSATATGTDELGNPRTNTDTADVKVIHPAIKITKDTTTPTIVSGGTASFTITIKNIGDSTLDNVKVDDTIAPDCARTAAEIALIAPHLSSTFAPGDEVSYTCTLSGQTASFTNSATATGTDELGNPRTNTDTADVKVIHPAIKITKDTTTPTIVSGGTASFTITIKNIGDSTLDNVKVDDTIAPDCARTAAEIALIAPHLSSTFAPGDEVSYTCTLRGQTASFTNSATATGTDELGNPRTNTDTADVKVIHPAIKITKDTTTPTIVSGGTASFTITIKNIGDSTLDNVKVDDTIAPDCARTAAEIALIAPHLSSTFAPGDEVSYTCTLQRSDRQLHEQRRPRRAPTSSATRAPTRTPPM